MELRNHRAGLWVALLMIMSLVLAACGGTATPTTGGTTPDNTPAPTAAVGPGVGETATTGLPSVGETATTGVPAVGETATTGVPPVGETAGPMATSTSGPSAGPVAPAPPCPDTAKGKTVEMWSPLTGGDGDEMTRLADQYTKDKTANPQGIIVKHTAQPEYLQRLNTSATANRLPTMTVIRVGDVPLMAERNIIKPMSADALAAIASGDVSGDFPEQIWAGGEYDGQRYAFPLDVHPLVMYYNKQLFEQAGIPEPGTEPMSKEDFEAAVQKLHPGGTIGWAIGTLFSSDTMFQMLTRQFGGRMVNDGGTEATYNTQEAVDALTYVRDMKQKYSPNISGTGDPEVVAFQQGKVAVVFHGPWWISSLEKLPFTGYAPIPQLGDEYAVWGGSHQFGLTTEDPAQQVAAGCWIGWMSANSAEWAKAGLVPIRNSVRASEAVQGSGLPVSFFASEADDVALYPPVPDLEGAVMTEASKAIAAVVRGGGQDPKAALDQAVTRSNQVIAKNAQTYGAR